MNRKENILKLLLEELARLEKEMIDLSPRADDEEFTRIVEDARRIAKTIRIIKDETP